MQTHYFKEFNSLRCLFLAELFERVSFFGVRAMLVLWLSKGLLFEDEVSFLTYGAFFALTYITPLIGGWFCDHFWGSGRTLKSGIVLEAIGYMILALAPAEFLYIGLGYVAFGAGFFKTAMMNLLGQNYQDVPSRRDIGFSVFYLSINVGGFLGPLICAAYGETSGWQYGFLICACSALLSLIFFLNGKSSLRASGSEVPDPFLFKWPSFLKQDWILYAGLIGLMMGSSWVFFNCHWLDIILPFLMIGGVVYLLYLGFVGVKSRGRDIAGIFFMLFLEVLFLALFEQAGSSISLFTERHVDRSASLLSGSLGEVLFFPSGTIPTSVFLALPCALMVMVGPVLSTGWGYLEDVFKKPLLSYKFAIGFMFLGLGFLLLKYSSAFMNSQGLISPWILIFTYLFHVIGELCVIPIILSTVTFLAPMRYAGRIWGVFFLAIASAHRLSGWLAHMTISAKGFTGSSSLESYYKGFETFGWLAIGTGGVLWALTPFIKPLFVHPAPQEP